jgi:alpha-galactosidase
MSKIGFSQTDLASWAGPGRWNDPDMLEVGNGGMSDTEYKTHMSLWSMLAAPLLAGNDLRHVEPSIMEILANRDVIAIDQDPAGQPAQCAWKSGEQEIWVRPFADGSRAVALFNRAADSAKITAKWADLGFVSPPPHARDLWLHHDVTLDGPEYSAMVPGHGVAFLHVSR